MNRLRPAKTPWNFGVEQRTAFDKLKQLLASKQVLTVYQPSLDLKLDADASKVGLGAVLSHLDENGEERPIEFISRTLNKAERNYSQIEREALSIVWAIKRFHRYLFARPFLLVTDHKPLEFIFHPHKGIPEMGISRIVRWALILGSYQYTIKFRPTHKHANADMCSRFPMDENGEDDKRDDFLDVESTVCAVHHVVSDSEALESIFSVNYLGDDKPLLDCGKIAHATRYDPVLSKLSYLVKEGWSADKEPAFRGTVTGQKTSQNSTPPRKLTDENEFRTDNPKLKPYFDRRHELSIDTGCILWGSRVVIPDKLRQDILELLHSTHMGMVGMKALARGYIWWPGLDADIERTARQCDACQENQRKPPKSVPHPWVKPSGPWERLHLDFCGPVFSSMWLVVIDSYSKWVEILRMANIKSGPVIRELRTLFSRFGISRVVVSDNGPQLTSDEMKNFMNRNGIHHIFIPSYHPASNGQQVPGRQI